MRRRAAKKVGGKGKEGHMEDPEAVAAAGGNKRCTPSQRPFNASERARLVHCVACPKFRPSVEIMLKGVTERVAIDDKMNRVSVYKELAIIFNNEEMVFDNFFIDRPHGDEELASLDPNDFLERPKLTLKGESMNNYVHCITRSHAYVLSYF